MKILKVILALILVPIIIFNLYILISGKWFIYKALKFNLVNVDDYKIFNNNIIPKSTNPQPWVRSQKYNKIKLSDTLNQKHKELKSIAFVVIQNDSIQVEQYWNGYSEHSLSNSFSMAKSVISMLIGVAIKEGKIKSVDQPVSDFLPAFANGNKSKITIKHLLMMSSGLDWDESNSYKNILGVFFSDIMEGYYGEDVNMLASNTTIAEPPGVYFDYKSGDTQLLAMVLNKVVGKSVSAYFAEKMWQPLGAQNSAMWSVDEKGNEKAFCCLNSNALDFARLGKLWLNRGLHNGEQIIDSAFVTESITPKNLKDKYNNDKLVDYYGYQFWLLPDYKGQKNYYMRGTLGQLVIIIPQKKIIIVRLGLNQGLKIGEHYAQTLFYIDEVNKKF